MNNDSMHQARLDKALQQTLVAPELPAGFRQRLRAALVRSATEDAATRRRQIELERFDQLAELHRDSVRLRLQTLGCLVGGAFVAGVGTALTWPWISATFAPHGSIALATIGAGLGVAIGLSSWVRRTGTMRWMQ